MSKFEIKKILQIINIFLEKSNGSINYTKLIKLLYIADKEFLKKWDYTITGDMYSSLKSGPVLSKVYDLIKGKSSDNEQVLWDSLFITHDYELCQLHTNKLGTDQLSKAEIKAMNDVFELYKNSSYTDLINLTHDKSKFPEVKWEEAGESSLDLPIEDLLKSLDRSTEEIEELLAEWDSQEKEKEFFLEKCV
ncbi:MAG: Panacea domain-containing protein [Leptospirales bacterium]